jgi:hypothetical protein
MEHFEELLPIVSVPTVREACQRYGLMFKSLPRGLFVTLEDRGRVFRWEAECVVWGRGEAATAAGGSRWLLVFEGAAVGQGGEATNCVREQS